MAFCENCGSPLPDDAAHCPECGMAVGMKQAAESAGNTVEAVFCPECGAKNAGDDQFCQECGTPLNGQAPVHTNAPGKAPVSDGKNPRKSSGGTGKWIAAGAAVVIVAGAAFAVPKILGGSTSGGSPQKGFTYEKDNVLYYTDGKKTLELTDRIRSDSSSTYPTSQTAYSSDGRYVFYTGKYGSGSEGTLYRRDLKKDSEKNDTEEKIASDVTHVGLYGDNIIYTKGYSVSNGYQSDIYLCTKEDSEKLCSGASSYYVSKDGTSLLWLDDEQRLYRSAIGGKGEKEKLDSDVTDILSTTDDLNTVYYKTSDTDLYCAIGMETKRVDSDVEEIFPCSQNKCVYYTVKGKSYEIRDFVIDDSVSYYDYWAEQQREDLNNASPLETYELYLFDGKESKRIMDNVDYVHRVDPCIYIDEESSRTQEKAYIAVSAIYDQLPRISFSQVSRDSSVTAEFFKLHSNFYNGEVPARIVAPGASLDVIYGSKYNYHIDTVNHVIYRDVLEERTKDGSSSYQVERLEKIPYTQNGLKEAVVIDDDYDGAFSDSNGDLSYAFYVDDSHLYYITDYNYDRYRGSLRCDGTELLDDVGYLEKNNNRLFARGAGAEMGKDTDLWEISGTKVTEYGSDIYEYFPLSDGRMALLQDYSDRRYEGDLYLWKNGKTEKLDEDVRILEDNYYYID